VSLWPFPSEPLVEAAANARSVMVVELSTGQMVEDVRLALNGSKPVDFYSRVGGNVPSVDEIYQKIMSRVGALV
jgi:pyruvate/2-oxoacid:ferredoxin oxidoreductase alpha subunit